MWRKILTVVAVILLVVGLGFLLFPPVSNFVGQKRADAIVADFDKNVENITETVTTEDGEVIDSLEKAKEKGYVDDEGYPVTSVTYYDDGHVVYGDRTVYKKDLNDLLQDSLAYNERLITGQGTEDTIQYDKSVFDLKDYGIDDGVYAYISIDAIDMRLPVYLGSDEIKLSCGAAHLYGTSLPVGDNNINVAIAGHTAYVGRIFFDNLRKLEIGDKVSITTYWDTTYYEVIDYKTITPEETNDLLIQKDRNLLTLITCIYTGRGAEFDRYLVICEKKK